MKKQIVVACVLCLVVCGCEGLQQGAEQQLTDPNSQTQQIAAAVIQHLEAAEPLEKILEKTPIGLPISAVFNALLLGATLIYRMRGQKLGTALGQIVSGVQAARQMLSAEAKATLDNASRAVQDSVTTGMVKEIKAQPDVKTSTNAAVCTLGAQASSGQPAAS